MKYLRTRIRDANLIISTIQQEGLKAMTITLLTSSTMISTKIRAELIMRLLPRVLLERKKAIILCKKLL
jgi:hypothetical protein